MNALKEMFEKLQIIKGFSEKYLRTLADSIKYKLDPKSEQIVNILKTNIARMHSKKKIQENYRSDWYLSNAIPFLCVVLVLSGCTFGVVVYFRKKAKATKPEESEKSIV